MKEFLLDNEEVAAEAGDEAAEEELWASGGIHRSYIGRATQGHFKASAGIGPVAVTNNDQPVLDVHAHWDGPIWWSCT